MRCFKYNKKYIYKLVKRNRVGKVIRIINSSIHNWSEDNFNKLCNHVLFCKCNLVYHHMYTLDKIYRTNILGRTNNYHRDIEKIIRFSNLEILKNVLNDNYDYIKIDNPKNVKLIHKIFDRMYKKHSLGITKYLFSKEVQTAYQHITKIKYSTWFRNIISTPDDTIKYMLSENIQRKYNQTFFKNSGSIYNNKYDITEKMCNKIKYILSDDIQERHVDRRFSTDNFKYNNIEKLENIFNMEIPIYDRLCDRKYNFLYNIIKKRRVGKLMKILKLYDKNINKNEENLHYIRHILSLLTKYNLYHAYEYVINVSIGENLYRCSSYEYRKKIKEFRNIINQNFNNAIENNKIEIFKTLLNTVYRDKNKMKYLNTLTYAKCMNNIEILKYFMSKECMIKYPLIRWNNTDLDSYINVSTYNYGQYNFDTQLDVVKIVVSPKFSTLYQYNLINIKQMIFYTIHRFSNLVGFVDTSEIIDNKIIIDKIEYLSKQNICDTYYTDLKMTNIYIERKIRNFIQRRKKDNLIWFLNFIQSDVNKRIPKLNAKYISSSLHKHIVKYLGYDPLH